MRYHISLLIYIIYNNILFVNADRALKIKQNPKNVVAIADFPYGLNTNVSGLVFFTSKKGKAVKVHMDITGLPLDKGPFFYHIHENQITDKDTCGGVGSIYNPYNSKDDCDGTKDDSYCAIGDLSGKHGIVNSTCYGVKYYDSFLSLNRKSKSYIIGKSLVFHYQNNTKFACANINEASESMVDQLAITEKDFSSYSDLFHDVDDNYVFDEEQALKEEVYENDGNENDFDDQIGSDDKIKHINNLVDSYESIKSYDLEISTIYNNSSSLYFLNETTGYNPQTNQGLKFDFFNANSLFFLIGLLIQNFFVF